MQIAGRTSWRLSEQDGGNLYLALLARDAAGLEVPPASDVPPPVCTSVDRLPVAPSAAAADQWVTWWRGLVSFQADEASPSRRPRPEDDVHAWLDATRQRHMAVFDPPRFESLTSMPELRAVASAMFAGDGQLLVRLDEPTGMPPAAFDYQVVRAAAEDAIDEFDVDPGEINGTVQFLDVQGAWSCLAAPGYALCSTQLAADANAAAQVLRAVFASRLGRT
jgi:hypothetical protein